MLPLLAAAVQRAMLPLACPVFNGLQVHATVAEKSEWPEGAFRTNARVLPLRTPVVLPSMTANMGQGTLAGFALIIPMRIMVLNGVASQMARARSEEERKRGYEAGGASRE